MSLYIPHSIFHLARLLYVRPEKFGPYYVYYFPINVNDSLRVSRMSKQYSYCGITLGNANVSICISLLQYTI